MRNSRTKFGRAFVDLDCDCRIRSADDFSERLGAGHGDRSARDDANSNGRCESASRRHGSKGRRESRRTSDRCACNDATCNDATGSNSLAAAETAPAAQLPCWKHRLAPFETRGQPPKQPPDRSTAMPAGKTQDTVAENVAEAAGAGPDKGGWSVWALALTLLRCSFCRSWRAIIWRTRGGCRITPGRSA